MHSKLGQNPLIPQNQKHTHVDICEQNYPLEKPKYSMSDYTCAVPFFREKERYMANILKSLPNKNLAHNI